MLNPKYDEYEKILVIVSDGEFDTGNLPQSLITSVETLADLLKECKVTIINLYVTNRNVIGQLVSRISPQWSTGAKTMFRISSDVGDNSYLAKFLPKKNPDLPLNSKLFIQINESKLLQEVFSVIFAIKQ